MKRIITLAIVAIIATTVSAQTQQGRVRTLGRPNLKSQGLSGVVITVTDAPGSVLSRAAGDFSISLPGKKEGDPYTIGSVQKRDYMLVDKGIRGRRFGFSSKVPLEIVMVSRQQLEKDRQRIEDNATEKATKRFDKQRAELDRLRREKKLSEEEYAKKQQKLGEDFDKLMSLVDRMAETYSLMDYDNISEINRQIGEAIENSELEKADSLILSKGDYAQREKDIKLTIELGEKAKAIGEKQLNEGFQKRDDLASDYYNQHTICTQQYKFEEAANYLERRSALDSHNIVWRLETANYISDYLSDYDRSEIHAQKALQVATDLYGEESLEVAYCLNGLAAIYSEAGKFDSALSVFKESARIRKLRLGEFSKEYANSCKNIALTYKQKEAFDSARVYNEMALKIYENIDDGDAGVGSCYVSIGMIERLLGHMQTALEYYEKALPLTIENSGEYSEDMAILCNALAGVNKEIDSLDIALSWYERALNIERKLYGDEHPNVAPIIDNIGTFYGCIGSYNESYKYHKKALNIRLKTFGPDHPNTANSYNNFGVSLFEMGQQEEGMEFFKKALELDLRFYTENNSHVAMDYFNIASCLYEVGNYEESLDLNRKALDIYRNLYGNSHSKVADVLCCIADNYARLKNYDVAIDYYQQSLNIYHSIEGGRSKELGVLNNLSQSYMGLNEYAKSIDVLEDAVQIAKKVFGDNHGKLATLYSNMAVDYMKMGDYDKALLYNSKAITIKESEYDKNGSDISDEYYLSALIYEQKKDYENAIENGIKCVNIDRVKKGDDARAVIATNFLIYKNFNNLLTETPVQKNVEKFRNFMKDKCFVCIIVEGGAASAKGMTGEYKLLKLLDWDVEKDTTANFFTYHQQHQNSPKSIVVMGHDESIEAYDFEEPKIGVQFLLKYIDPKQKEEMIKSWQDWKNSK